MAKTSGQRTRILTLLKILLKKTDEDHPLNARQLIDLLGQYDIVCDRKTIYEDVEALEDMGYDIIHQSGKGGGYFIGSRTFEVSEIALLCDAVLSADFITGKKTTELIAKLKEQLSASEAEHIHDRLFSKRRKKCTNEEIYYTIDTLEQAIQKQKQVKLKYIRHRLYNGTRPEQSVKEMTVSPYAMVWANDRYYLICNNFNYDNLMHLRLDRIKNAVITDSAARHFSEVSEYKDHFDRADYVEKSFNMFGGETAEIKLECNAEILEQMIDRFGEEIYIQKIDDSHFIFSAKAKISKGLIGWILQFEKGIKVLAPPALKDSVLTALTETLNNYQ